MVVSGARRHTEKKKDTNNNDAIQRSLVAIKIEPQKAKAKNAKKKGRIAIVKIASLFLLFFFFVGFLFIAFDRRLLL